MIRCAKDGPRQGEGGHGGVIEPEHVSKFQAREPGEPNGICGETVLKRGFKTDRWFHVSDAKDQMDVVRQSDGSVVSTKSANNGASEASAEWMEKRDPAERNADQANPPQAQNRDKVGKSGLERVRDAARKDGKLKFVSLLHHADVDALRRSFYQLKKTAAVGIDGVTWQEYEHDLEAKLIDLHGRIHRESYQAKPPRRVWIILPAERSAGWLRKE